MASGVRSVTLLYFCTVLFFLLLADVVAGVEQRQQPDTGGVGSTQEFYLRGATNISTKEVAVMPEESFEDFERRELVEYSYSDPANPNCEHDPTLCN